MDDYILYFIFISLFRADVLVKQCSNMGLVEESSGSAAFGGMDVQSLHATVASAVLCAKHRHFYMPTFFRSGPLSPSCRKHKERDGL